MILQRDTRLLEPIRRWGCYFMSILFLTNKYKNVHLSADYINELYGILIGKWVMDSKCFIKDPEGVFSWVGMNVKFSDRHEPVDYACLPREIEILRYQVDAWIHFVVGDGQGHVAYDPWGDSRAVREGVLQDKRIFRRL